MYTAFSMLQCQISIAFFSFLIKSSFESSVFVCCRGQVLLPGLSYIKVSSCSFLVWKMQNGSGNQPKENKSVKGIVVKIMIVVNYCSV